MFCTQETDTHTHMLYNTQYMRHTTFNFNRTKTKIDTYPDTKETQ